MITKNNWMNEKLIIFLSNISLFLKFLIERKNIGKEIINPKIRE
jgi:hypothetical protein